MFLDKTVEHETEVPVSCRRTFPNGKLPATSPALDDIARACGHKGILNACKSTDSISRFKQALMGCRDEGERAARS